MHPLSNYPKVCIREIKLKCLQVPGWRAKSCWLDFSSCCCCCCWCPRQCSRCCHQTSSVSVAYSALVLPAQLQGQRQPGYSQEGKSNMQIVKPQRRTWFVQDFLPGGATILCHFWNKHVFKQSRGLRLYVLCLDINSCMGSRITQSWRRNKDSHVTLFSIQCTGHLYIYLKQRLNVINMLH